MVHWSFRDQSPTGEKYINAQSRIFSALDETLVTHLRSLKKMTNLEGGPVVEKVTHSELTTAEKKRLEVLEHGF